MNLTTLEKKEPREMLKVLSAVSSSLLPNPNVGSSANIIVNDEIISQVMNEIRLKLNISKDDYSISAQSKIFEFLSKEISNIALTSENILKIKKRLGAEGKLSLSEYKIIFPYSFRAYEMFGEKKSNIIETVNNPDNFQHLESKYLLKDVNERIQGTLITRLVTPKKSQDKFIQIVVCSREGDVLNVAASMRAYFSEMNLNGLNYPLDILKEFINTYGLTIKFDDFISKIFINEVINYKFGASPEDLKILDGQINDFYARTFFGNKSDISGMTPNSELSEIIMAFAINLTKYSSTLKKHNVYINIDKPNQLRRVE